MNIADVIEEKYTNWLNCETDELDLTIEEAKHILVNNHKQRYVDELLEESWKIVLSELEKKEAIINEMAEQLAGLAIFDIEKDEPLVLGDKEEVKEYFTKKSEKEGIKE